MHSTLSSLHVALILTSAFAKALSLTGWAGLDIASIRSDGSSNGSFMNERIPEQFRTSVNFKSKGEIFDRTDWFVDYILTAAPLALYSGWNEAFETNSFNAIETTTKFSSSRAPGSPGWRIKYAMWSLYQILGSVKERGQYQELGFWSQMGPTSPVIGFGQTLKLQEVSGNKTEVTMNQLDTTFSRRGLVRRDQPNVFCANFYKISRTQLPEFGIYASILALIMQQSEAAAQTPATGLDTVVKGNIAVINYDSDVSVSLSSTSKESQTLTIRKAIWSLTSLASEMAGFQGVDRFRPVEFRIREGDGAGAVIGRGQVKKGLPMMESGTLLLQIGHDEMIGNSTAGVKVARS